MASYIIGGIAIVLMLGLLWGVVTQEEDPTTDAEIANASNTLKEELKKAAALVAERCPDSLICFAQLEQARACLSFDKHSSRLVVSARMVLEKRNQGIEIARKLIESINSRPV